ncbi:MAG: nucleoside triphosphate pyrophosphohydrolase [Chthoniobacterales bacterium]
MTRFERLCEIVARLRAPGGCPWDREQTNSSLAPALLEEAYETTAAIRAYDDSNLREELGDLLLLVTMHAQIAEEAGRFAIDDVAAGAIEKLVRRHPHVFGENKLGDSGAVLKQWEAIKREEKKMAGDHYLAGIPAVFPALMRAQKAQSKAARVNFDWSETRDVTAKIEEEFEETKAALASGNEAAIADEIGDLLFAVTNLARKCKLDAETVLQAGTDKFIKRFNQMEDRLRAAGKQLRDVSLADLDEQWTAIKAERDHQSLHG